MNDLIRPRQHRRRDREAEGFGGLEINDQLYCQRLVILAASGANARLLLTRSGRRTREPCGD